MKPSSYLFKPTNLLSLLLLCNLIAFSRSFSSTQPRCHDNERSSLLQFKESFVVDNSINGCDPFAPSKIDSWKLFHGERISDCCSWDGVECDEETNHVISLDLSSSCLFGSINSNSSLFHLLQLRKLNLAYNDFNFSPIPARVGHFLRLTHLNLSSSGFSGEIPDEISNLSSLISLDLSGNNDLRLHKLSMRGLVQNLAHLKALHLSKVDISSRVPDLLANFVALESLQLDQCELQGEFSMGIFKLPKLKMLDISGNSDLKVSLPDFQKGSPLKSLMLSEVKFVGEIPSSVGNLGNLEELDISRCNLTGQIPSSLGNLTKLTLLSLSYNDFRGQNSSLSWIGKLNKLTFLDLHGINLNDNLPSQLMNLTQLSYLDLGYCQLTGPIPSWLGNLTELSAIFLDHNQLIGRIPSSLIYRSNIEYLFLSSNQFSGPIPSVNNTLSQLSHLDISSNILQGSIPSSLSKLQNLVILELHSNSLTGEVDINMFLQLSSLVVLSLSFNNLMLLTKISSNANVQKFKFLGLASCNLSEFPGFLHNQDHLQVLDLSSNNIHGQIPSWVWNISTTSMYFMNLSHNFLTGFQQDPYPVVLQWTHLKVLDLRSNMLRGSLSIPPPSSNIWRKECNLEMINLSQNLIKGKVPRSIASCKKLELLDLSNNRFTDSFPSWVGNLPKLRILNLRSNGFHGVIKNQKTLNFSKLQIIDLSHNNLTGELPSKYFESWNAMKVADANHTGYIGKNQEFTVSAYYSTYDYSMIINIKGSQMEYLKIPGTLAVIDFSHNRFVGDIPEAIANLKALHLLNFSNNILRGHIPSSLANLKELECLDLSANKFSGEIPPQLTQLTFLSSFNVAYNQLEGPIPGGNQFNTFGEEAYAGNIGLCGAPLKKKCGDVEASAPPPSSLEKDDDGSGSPFEFDWKIVLLGYGSGFVVGGIVGHIFTRRKRGWILRTFRFGKKQPRRRQRQTRNRNRH